MKTKKSSFTIKKAELRIGTNPENMESIGEVEDIEVEVEVSVSDEDGEEE